MLSSSRMIGSAKSNVSFMFVFIVTILLLYTAIYRTSETNPRQVSLRIVQKQVCVSGVKTNTTPTTEDSKSKPFIYLTQTEQCLPSNMSSSRAIGDSKTCNCDVIVLSYKQECREEKPSHISYILFRESTWTTGRNILYFVARERKPAYHYYIFLDDDVDLRFKSFAPQAMKMLSPFRVFEQWLLDNEPAVGVPDHGEMGRDLAEFISERRRTICGINETSRMTLPTMWFDAILDAFHHKAFQHILPYPTQYDKESWWASQLHVIYSSELKFRGQVLVFAPIEIHNPIHREYPRTKMNFDAHIREFVKEIQNRAPIAYRNRTLFKVLKNTQREVHFMRTTTYCMNTTRRPIVPYSHFDQESL